MFDPETTQRNLVLAIASSSFSKPSETFVRHHATLIAPRQTLCLSWEGEETAIDLPRVRIPVPRRGLVRDLFGPLGASDCRAVAKQLSDSGVSRLMTEFGGTGVALRAPAADAGLPLHVHFHGRDVSRGVRKSWIRRSYRKLFDQAVSIIAPSDFLRRSLVEMGCPREKTHVVPCGVRISEPPSSRDEPGRILSVGRLVDKKSPLLTIEAFASIAEEYPHARLDIVGDGPLREKCEKAIARHGLEARVRVAGFLPHEEVLDLLRRASIFVLHSVTAPNGDTEGLPVSILEAMNAALPVISTRHSGIPEAVENGTHGLLVEEHDQAGTARAMAELLRDPARAADMGAAGRERAMKQFSLEHTIGKLRDIMGLSAEDGGAR